MPAVSEAQRRAMWAAAEGKSNIGIPESVGKEFVGKDSRAVHGLIKALILDAGRAAADGWITVKPNGERGKGRPALIGEGGVVQGGMGGKFNGEKISSIGKSGGPSKQASSAKKYGEQEGASTTEKAAKAPSKKDVSALESYTHAGSYPINDLLRNGTKVNSGRFKDSTHLRTDEDVSSAIKDLDEAFKSASLPKDTTVYRGVNNDTWKIIKDNAEKDGVIQDDGFVSTAKNRKDVSASSLTHWMEIRVPEGYPAIDLDAIGVGNRTKGEILLDRGAKFKVVKMTKNGAVLEVIPKDKPGRDSCRTVEFIKALIVEAKKGPRGTHG